MDQPQPVDGTMLTTAQLAEALQVSTSTVKRWRSQGKIAPEIATGRIVRYRWPVEVVQDQPARAKPLRDLPSFDREAVVLETRASELPDLYADAIASFMDRPGGSVVAVALLPLEGHDGEASA